MKKWFSSSNWRQLAVTGPLFVVLGFMIAAHDRFNASTPVQARPVTGAAAAPAETTREPEVGPASYYGLKYQGRPTASGEIFDRNQLTAAHPTLPFGTKVKVTNLANDRSVIVRINDRGPFVRGRIIDLSEAAAEELQYVPGGVAQVKVEVVR